MKNYNPVTFDFDEWANMAKSDPSRFEEMRLNAIEQLIDSAPATQQNRLRGLQWNIDQQRLLAKTPMGACIRLSQMMWDSVNSDNGLLKQLKSLHNLFESPQHSHEKASQNAEIVNLCDMRERKLLQNA